MVRGPRASIPPSTTSHPSSTAAAMSKRRPSVASTTSPPAVLSPARSFSGALGLALTSPTHERASGPLSPPLLSPRAGHDIKPALVRSETSQSDVAKHDPDDLFRRLTVGEVKRVEARLRFVVRALENRRRRAAPAHLLLSPWLQIIGALQAV